MHKVKLSTRIILLVICVAIMSLSVVSILVSYWSVKNIHREEEHRIIDIANIIANRQDIRNALSNQDPDGMIQGSVQQMINSTEHIEVIVVADMEGIRYGHPVSDRVGKNFVGGDEKEVLENGKSYISDAVGTLGHELRAFVPIFDLDNESQIGFAMVGTFTHSIDIAKRQSIIIIILSSFVGLFIGIVGAFILASNIKNTLLGLEPEEISKLYIEKEGMLEAIHEGIISINENCKITLINDSAIKMLDIKEKNIHGKNIMEVIATSRLPQVLNSGIAEYNQEQVIGNTIIVTNRVPIMQNGKAVGAVASFRDKTQVTQLAEEITGVRQIIEALRANTHEFMNKLHVILGLLQLEEYEVAKDYILQETQKQQQVISLIIKKIKNPTIAALILGKFNRAKELDIGIHISKDTYLSKYNENIPNNLLITIIGNLIENAMDALRESDREEKIIYLSLLETKQELIIEVEDNGIGIPKEHVNSIFKRGFTSKGDNVGRGVGLSLVKKAVQSLKGAVEVYSESNQYTKFTVSIPKGEK